MLKFRKGTIVTQLASFEIDKEEGLEEYNTFCLKPYIEVIGEREKVIPGMEHGPDGKGGVPGKLVLLVKYLIPMDKVKEMKRNV